MASPVWSEHVMPKKMFPVSALVVMQCSNTLFMLVESLRVLIM